VTGATIVAAISQARTLTANFAIDRDALVVSSAHGLANPPVGTNGYNYGTSLKAAITNSPVTSGATQYVCAGWIGTGSVPAAGTTTNTGAFTLTGNSTVTWIWHTNYWLKPQTSAGGTVSATARWCSLGSNVCITATPSNHYHFVSWSGDTGGCEVVGSTITATMNRTRTITANFAIDRFALVVSSAHGLASPPVGTNGYNYGSTLKAAVTNSPVTSGTTQYVCASWIGTGNVPSAGTTTNTGTFAMSSNSTITWIWRTNYWLKPQITAGGRVNVAAAWHSFGASVKIVATASNGYIFSSWSGDIGNCTVVSNSITFLMTGPRTITARFTASTNGAPSGENAMVRTRTAATKTSSTEVVPSQIHIDPAHPGAVVISWSGEADCVYSIKKSTNLALGPDGFAVLPGADNISGSASQNTWTDPMESSGPVFYKVERHAASDAAANPD
jgi:hypothetical protein